MRRYITLRLMLLVSIILLSGHILCPDIPAASLSPNSASIDASRGSVRSKTAGTLRGGCSKVNITSPLGIPLIGSYGKPSDEVLDELYAKALVLNDGSNTIAIVSVDLLYVSLEEITNPIREIIEEEIGIPERNVFICATHTHSGPEVFTRSKLGPEKEVPASEIDQFYLQTLIRKTASSVMLAYKNIKEGSRKAGSTSRKAGAQVKIGAAKGAGEIMIKQALALISQIK